MPQKTKKKLTLNKETLRQLNDAQLSNAAGGYDWTTPIPPPPPSMFCSYGCITDGLCLGGTATKKLM